VISDDIDFCVFGSTSTAVGVLTKIYRRITGGYITLISRIKAW